MEKRKKTLFVSFATQKGGVGKSTFTIYAASWLHYVKGLNVAVVDCDYPQHSIIKQKKRDMEVVKTTPVYQNLLVEQAGRLKKKAYPVIGSTPANCMADWRAFEEKADIPYDIVLFDLPGTMGSDGVIAAISALDYLFVPIKADRLVLESTLNFATTINDRLIKTGISSLKRLCLFWNMVDRREPHDLVWHLSTRLLSIRVGLPENTHSRAQQLHQRLVRYGRPRLPEYAVRSRCDLH